MTRYLTLALLVLGCSADPGGPDLGTGGSLGGSAGEPIAETGGTDSGGSAGLGGQGGAPVLVGLGEPCDSADDCEIPGVPSDLVICEDVKPLAVPHATRCTFRCHVDELPVLCRDYGDTDPRFSWLCVYDDGSSGPATCR